jgi:PAS domain S-box-containing protein
MCIRDSIFLTALTNDQDIIKGMQHGAVDFITKPFNEEIFLLRVKSVISQHRKIDNYSSLFTNMNAGMVLFEAVFDNFGMLVDTRYLEVNAEFEELVGKKAHELNGKTMLEVTPSTDKHCFIEFDHMINSFTPHSFEMQHEEQDAWLKVKAYPITVNTFAAVFTDITKTKKAELKQHVLARVSSLLISSTNIDQNIERSLAIIGGLYQFSRIYIYTYTESGEYCLNTHEWLRTGVSTQLDNLQTIPMDYFPSFRELLTTNGEIRSSDVNTLPEDIINILRPLNVQSIYICPLAINEKEIGFVGYDFSHCAHTWSDDEIEFLRTVTDILSSAFERIHSEKELQLANKELTIIFNNSPLTHLILNEKSEILKVNRTAINGAHGKRNKKLLPGDLLHCVKVVKENNTCGEAEACQHCFIRQTFNKTIESGDDQLGIEGEAKVVDNGQLIKKHVKISTSVFHTNENEKRVLVSLDDITEQKENECELQRSKQRAEALLRIAKHDVSSEQGIFNHALHEAIALTESEIGYIFKYNEQTKEFSLEQWSDDVMFGCKVLEPKTIYKLEETGLWGEVIRQQKPIVINQYNTDHELSRGTPEGHLKLKRFLAIPIILEMQIVGTIGVANKKVDYSQNDITQLILMMDAVWKDLERLKHRRELQKSSREKDIYISALGHDLNSLIGGSLQFIDLIESEGITNGEKELVISQLTDNTKTAHNLLMDLTAWGRMSLGMLTPNPSTLELEQELLEVIKLYKTQLANKKISVLLDVEQEIRIKADKHLLAAVLRNILRNAIKYSNFNGNIKLDARQINEGVEITIGDEGVGMSQEKVNEVFYSESFFSSPGTDGETGSGIGLILVKEFIQQMKGSIKVNSKKDIGTQVSISLPSDILKS